MTHVRELIHRSLEQEAAPSEEIALDRHIRVCDACRELRSELRRNDALLSHRDPLPIVPPFRTHTFHPLHLVRPAALTVTVLVLALVAGMQLAGWRAANAPVASPSAAPVVAGDANVGVCASARSAARGWAVRRVDRIESKRVSLKDFTDAGGTVSLKFQLPEERASGLFLCVVAIAGEIDQQRGLVATPPATWALFVSVAGSNETITSIVGSGSPWPPIFDALPDRTPAPYPAYVIEVLDADTIRVAFESAKIGEAFGRAVLRADKFTQVVPSAPTVAATGVKPGDWVGVAFEREGRDPASGAYPLSIFQLRSSAQPRPIASGDPLPPGIVLDVRTGSGPDQPGVTRTEGVARGPASIAVDDMGLLYLWDRANARVMVYDAGRLARVVKVSLPADARELEVLNGTMYFARNGPGTRQEWELDATTGAVLRTVPPAPSGGQTTFYRTARWTPGTPSVSPGTWPIGVDRYGNRYERWLDGTCSRGAAVCLEIRRRAATGTLIATATEPAGIAVEDYYVARDGAVYELRMDRVRDDIVGVFVIRLLSAAEATSPRRGGLPVCSLGELPLLDVSRSPSPGDQPGTGAPSAEDAFRRAYPAITTFTMYPLGSDQATRDPSVLGRGAVWIVAGSDTYVALYFGEPGLNSWFAHRATFLGCRDASARPSPTPTLSPADCSSVAQAVLPVPPVLYPTRTAAEVTAGLRDDAYFRHTLEDVAGVRQDSNPLRDAGVPRCAVEALWTGEPVFVRSYPSDAGLWYVPVIYGDRQVLLVTVGRNEAGLGVSGGSVGGGGGSGGMFPPMSRAKAIQLGGTSADPSASAELVFASAIRGTRSVAWRIVRTSGAVFYLFPDYPGAGPDGMLLPDGQVLTGD